MRETRDFCLFYPITRLSPYIKFIGVCILSWIYARLDIKQAIRKKTPHTQWAKITNQDNRHVRPHNTQWAVFALSTVEGLPAIQMNSMTPVLVPLVAELETSNPVIYMPLSKSLSVMIFIFSPSIYYEYMYQFLQFLTSFLSVTCPNTACSSRPLFAEAFFLFEPWPSSTSAVRCDGSGGLSTDFAQV